MKLETIKNQKKSLLMIVQLGILIILSTAIQAQNVNPSADTYVSEKESKVNYGQTDVLMVGVDQTGNETRTYLQFDIEASYEHEIESATLRLYNNNISGNNGFLIGINTISEKWNEGAGKEINSVAIALPGETSWINQPAYSNDPIMMINVGASAKKWVDIDISQIVKKWVTNKNFGIVLSPIDKINGTTCTFYSKEYEGATKRPQLIIIKTDGTQSFVKAM